MKIEMYECDRCKTMWEPKDEMAVSIPCSFRASIRKLNADPPIPIIDTRFEHLCHDCTVYLSNLFPRFEPEENPCPVK